MNRPLLYKISDAIERVAANKGDLFSAVYYGTNDIATLHLAASQLATAIMNEVDQEDLPINQHPVEHALRTEPPHG